MATKKAGGTAKNITYQRPKYLGVKLYAGEKAQQGSVIIRQRGTKFIPGKNTDIGSDHTIYSRAVGVVEFKNKRKTRFDGKQVMRKVVIVK